MRIACQLALTALIAAGAAWAQTLQTQATLPQIKGTSLDDQEITLPDAAAGKVTFLVITFSKAAGEKGRSWNERFFKDYPQEDKITSYSIAMLEDVPAFLRGMIRSGIRRSIPVSMRRRFLTAARGEAEWKRYVGMQDDKDSYLILFNSKGRVQWMHHGQFDPAVYEVLRAKIAELLAG